MEVHHHPKVERKKVKEYFFEFIMIFLAVTLGFIAENMREHFIEKTTEKRNVEMVINGLKNDTARINTVIFRNMERIKILDTILSFQNKKFIDTIHSIRFYLSFVNSGQRSFFHSDDAAFEQMKSSGSIRLIKNTAILDSIYRYGLLNTALYHNEYYLDQWQNAADRSASKFMNLQKAIPGTNDSALFGSDFAYSGNDETNIIREFFNDEAMLRMVLVKYYLHNLQSQYKSAVAIIQFLQKEYHLERR